MILRLSNPANTPNRLSDVRRVCLTAEIRMTSRSNRALTRSISIRQLHMLRPSLDILRRQRLTAKDERPQTRHFSRLDQLDNRRGQEGPGDAKIVDDGGDAAALGPLVGHADAGAHRQCGYHFQDAHVEAVRRHLQHSAVRSHRCPLRLGARARQEVGVLDNAALGLA